MGPIEERLELELEQVKTFLRVDGAEDDDTIQDMIDAAKQKADEYCNNYFTDDGTAEGEPQAIPKAIKTWCLSMIARAYERRLNGVTTEYSKDLSQTIWGGIDYSDIFQYRMEPGF